MANESNSSNTSKSSKTKVVMTYPAMMKDDLKEFKDMRRTLLIVMIVGLLLCIFLGPGILTVILFVGGLVGFIFAHYIYSMFLNRIDEVLNDEEFQFDSRIDVKTVYDGVMPILRAKYAMSAELNNNGGIIIVHKGIMYTFAISEDDSFTIASEIAQKNTYPLYKQKLTSIGLIAYEIQRYFNMNYPNYAAQN